MACTSVIDHTIKQGGSFSHLFTAKDCEENVINLTSYTITAKARFRDSPNIEAKVTMLIANTDLPNGQFTVSLLGTTTANMKQGVWEFDAKMVNGTSILTMDTRTLLIKELIT